MSHFLQLAFLLPVILLSAKIAGYLSIHLGQPSVLGELQVGILLGPSLINLLNLPFIGHELTETITLFGELGVLLLMFLAGLELHLGDLDQPETGMLLVLPRLKAYGLYKTGRTK